MVDFAKLAADAKARREAAENPSAGPKVSESTPDNSEAHAAVRGDAPEPATIPCSESAGASEAKRPANPFGKRKDTGSGDSPGPAGEGPVSSGGVDSGSEQPKSRLAAISLGAGPQSTDSDASALAAPTLDSLDALDQSVDEGIAPRPSVTSQFTDETPATKPTRELPEGLTKEQLGFVDMIDGVFEVMHEPDLLGGVIRNIIIELKSNPEYMKLVAPDDIRAWVRGMRESMGLQKIKKQETKSRKSGGSGSKSKLVDTDMLNDLADLGIDIPA